LDELNKASDHDDPLLRQSSGSGILKLPSGKTGEDVSADFLRCLYDHILVHLGGVFGPEIVEETNIDFYLTVPAAWSMEARRATRDAAGRSGIGSRFVDKVQDQLLMIDEPEAAAICALKTRLDSPSSENVFQVRYHSIIVVSIVDCVSLAKASWS
jgi:hypothetical protein